MAAVKQPVSINDIEFDALIESTELNESEVPAYPVETGYSVSDSIILKPRTLDMTLYLTNTPVTWLGRHAASPTRVQDTIRKLKELYFKRELVTVTTMRGVNRNMAIVSIELTNSIENGTSREIPISFQEIRFTESKTTTIPDSYGRSGSTGANAGSAKTKKSSATSTSAQSADDQGGDRGSLLYNAASTIGIIGSDSSQPSGGAGPFGGRR